MAAALSFSLYIMLGLIATFALVGFVLLWIVGRRKISRLETHERKRLRAIPFMGDGPIPPDRDRAPAEDTASFLVVLRLFFRAWPYIKPQVFGRWYVSGEGLSPDFADDLRGSGYSFWYAAVLATAAAIIPLITGSVALSTELPLVLLYPLIAAMVVAAWAVTLGTAGSKTTPVAVLVTAGVLANILATLVIEGIADGLYTAGVTLSLMLGWLLQVRIGKSQFQFRIRLHAHLIYYYFVDFLQRFINFVLGLVMVDLLNQTIFQAQLLSDLTMSLPILPWLAESLGYPLGAIAELSEAQRLDMIWLYVGILIGAWVLQFPLNFFKGIYMVWILQRINQDLRLALVERWHRLSLNYHSDHRVGDSIYRIYQDSAQVTAVIQRLVAVVQALMTYFTCVFLVSLLSPWIGLIAISVVIPGLLWARWAMPRMRVRSLIARATNSDLTSRIQEAFSAFRIIKANSASTRVQNLLEQDSAIAFNAAYRARSIVAFVTIIMFTIASAFLIGGEFTMAWWANQSNPTWASELMALVGVSFVVWNLAAFNWTKGEFDQASGSVRWLMRQWLQAQDLAMGLQRVFNILDIEPDIEDEAEAVPLDAIHDEIRFDRVSFNYEPGRPVLSDVSFTAKPGTVTAIVGPTGSGKTTVMSLLLRLYDPASGSITIDARNINQFQVQSLRGKVAIALQENVLFASSVRDNIRYVVPDADEDAVRDAVRVACMDDYIDGLPFGLDTILGDRGGKLSTGQRQRLSIARAVVRDTPILILDEPTAALDAATEHRVMNNLAEWGRDRVIFLITHRISTIRRADNILYLDEGHIIENGDHAALMSIEGGRYRAFVDAESSLSAIGG